MFEMPNERFMKKNKFIQQENFVLDYIGDINFECDIILNYLNVNKSKENKYKEIYAFSKTLLINLIDVVSILKNDEFIKEYEPSGNGIKSELENLCLQITHKGVAFIKTDSYVERQKRWDLDKETKRLEYLLKSKTFFISIIALLISLGSVIISLITLIKK